MTQDISPERIERERKLFEEWYEESLLPLEFYGGYLFVRDEYGDYEMTDTATAYGAWCARAALAADAPALLAERIAGLKEARDGIERLSETYGTFTAVAAINARIAALEAEMEKVE